MGDGHPSEPAVTDLTFPKPYRPGIAVRNPRNSQRVGFSYYDADSFEHFCFEFPDRCEADAARTAKLWCATVGANEQIILRQHPRTL